MLSSRGILMFWKNMRVTVASLTFLLAACATDGQLLGNKDLLNFLSDGSTSRQTITLKLGEPSTSYESNAIVTYRIGCQKDGSYIVLLSRPGSWAISDVEAYYSLVLIFDGNDVLLQHSLVRIW